MAYDFPGAIRTVPIENFAFMGYQNGAVFNKFFYVKRVNGVWYFDLDRTLLYGNGQVTTLTQLLDGAGGGGGGGGGSVAGLIAVVAGKGILVDVTDPKRPVVSPDLIAGNGTTLTDPAVTHGDKLANAGQIAEAMKLILQEMGQYTTLAEIQQSFYTKGETYTQEDVNNFIDQIVAELTTNYYNRLQADQAAGELIIEAIKDLVKTADKANDNDVNAGTAGKWIDAEMLRFVLDQLGPVGGGGLTLADKASPTDLANGVANKWLDAQLMRARLGELAQYIEDKFSIPAGAEIGWVYTLRTIRNQSGAAETTYGWEPLGTGGTGGLTTTQVNQLISTALQDYAKKIDGKQVITADDVCVDLIRFDGNGTDVLSYRWAIAVRPSFQTGRDHLMVANTTDLQDGAPLLTQQDGFDLLRVVQSWFTAANLPTPVLPDYAVRGVVEALRTVVPPNNKMAPVLLEETLQDVVGSRLGYSLAPAELARLTALVSDPAWDGSDASLAAALPELRSILKAGNATPTDPFVRHSEMSGGGSGGTGTSSLVGPLAVVPQLRLRALGAKAEATPLPQQAWVRLPATFPTEIHGTWDANAGRVTVPATGQYEVFVQCLVTIAADAPPAELLVRVAGPHGVYSGDNGTTTTLGSVIEHSAVIAAEAGDELAFEVYTEASGVSLHLATLVARLMLVGEVARREVWAGAPAPWSAAAAPDPVNTPSVRRIVLGVPSGPLPGPTGGPFRITPTVVGEGGATAALAAADGQSGLAVSVGSQIGRLFRVSGRVAGAAAAVLEVTKNGPARGDVIGASPSVAVVGNPELPALPLMVSANATATRADFATPVSGAFYDAQTLYVASANAQLELKLRGGNSSGGQVILTDITPGGGDYIGVDLVADKTFTQAANSGFWGLDLAQIKDANGLWVPDNPAFCPISKADGYGHRFTPNHLPNGIYRFQAEFTITGEHENAGWRPGWNCNALVKDAFLPSYRTKNADGSVTYVIDTVYRCGTADGGTVVGFWFGITPTATSIGKPIGVKGWTKLRRLPQGTSTFTVELPFTKGQPISNTGSDVVCLNSVGQTRTGPGLLTYNANGKTGADDPHCTGATSWSGYGSPSPQGPQMAGTHGLFMQVSQAAANGCRWDAKVDLLADGALIAGELRQRRNGANHTTTNLVNQGKQADGNYLYTLDLPDLRGIDGKWFENFIITFARAATAGTKLVEGGITLTGTFNQFPLP